METFEDFCKWMGSQRRAAEALGISEFKVSRIVNDRADLTPALAEKIEQVSHGLFKKERVLWPSSSQPADKVA